MANVGAMLLTFKHVENLVLNGLRGMNKNFGGVTGILLAKRRIWHGQQQIHGGLGIINRSDNYGWDTEDYNHCFGSDIRSYK